MYGQRQSMYSRGRNTSRTQDNYQPQRNYSQGTGMGDQQSPDPQDGINEQPAAAPNTAQESQNSFSFQVIQPNPIQREKLLRMRRKEEEEYELSKQSRSLGHIDLPPSRLGGRMPESEARQQQQRIQSQSKYQKMLQREDQRRKQKEEEDAKIQQMKDIQRKKAEKLEENQQKQDLERKQKWHEDRQMRNKAFFDHLQPTNYTNDRPFGQPSEWGNNQAVKQDQTMREMDREDEWPCRAGNQEEDEDEDWMLKKVLEESMKTHKIEEEARLQKVTKPQYMQPKQQTYRQQQKEEEERQLKEMKETQRRKAELLQIHEEQRRLSQDKECRRVNKAFLDRFENLNV